MSCEHCRRRTSDPFPWITEAMNEIFYKNDAILKEQSIELRRMYLNGELKDLTKKEK